MESGFLSTRKVLPHLATRIRYHAGMVEPFDRLVWVDLEMTGLDPETCAIVEIATIVTDANLQILAEGPCLVIHQPDEVLSSMSSFVRDLHQKSGLLERIRTSSVTLEAATDETMTFLEKFASKGNSPLCGNSVWKDRSFLEKYMPRVIAFLHYRMVDVSTIKELVRRWYPQEWHAPKKKEVHRALDDIRESIEELKWYRSKVFAAVG
jgi:oligoribonuclease